MSRRRRLAVAAAAAVLGAVAVLAAGAPAEAQTAWGPPFVLVGPAPADYVPAQLAVGGAGQLAAGYATGDADTPGSAQAYLVQRSAAAVLGAPQALTGAQQVLALAFASGHPVALTGASPAGLDCCSSVSALAIAPGRRPQPLLGGLTGPVLGMVVPVAGGHLVAALAGADGVWDFTSGSGGRFTTRHRLSGRGQAATTLGLAAMGGASSLVAWTSASGPAGLADPRTIFYATGTRRAAPRQAVNLLTVAAGHRIDELAVARRRAGATAAWVETSYDGRLQFFARVRAADVGPRTSVRSFGTSGGPASGLTLVADPAGGQALAFKACGAAAICTVRVATRRPGGAFSSPVSLGIIDASQTPSLAVGPRGQVVVGWVRSGRPQAALGRVDGGHFGAPQVLATSAYAHDETVAYGPRGALAAWTQGTLNPSLVAAAHP